MRPVLLALTCCLLAGCPKGAARSARDPAAELLGAWTREQLDLRAWRSCARTADNVDLEQAVVVFSVDAEGAVLAMVLEPEDQAHDPAMICLAMELAHPPEQVPGTGEARTIRLRAGALHEVPGT